MTEKLDEAEQKPGDRALEGAESTERTVAFFADQRASGLLLTETIAQLISALDVGRGLVDLSSIPGLSIAAAFEIAGVPFDSLVFGQKDHYESLMPDRHPIYNPFIEKDAKRFRSLAAGVREVAVAEFGSIDANVVLIPAMVGPDEKLVDFSPGTLPGAVMTQLEELGRALVIVDTPERGLRAMPDGSYLRALIQVRGA